LLAAKLMGAIEEMPVTLGQSVKAGDVLVKIAAGEVSARVAQARTQLNTARRDLERERALLAKGASTQETVRNLEDRVSTNEAQLREAEVMLGYTTLRAPFEGVIARKVANAGDLAVPGTTLLELHGNASFEVEAAVPETAAAQLKIGAPVGISIPATDVTFTGKIAEISSSVDAEARAVLIKVAVPQGVDVRSGQFARLQIPGEPRRAIRIPAAAVSMFGQMERVFALGESNRAALRLVKTGGRLNDRVEILAGLSEGDRIIVSPPAGLRDGQPVEVRQ
jgi:RND family efflux transporter MFP subunit